MVINITSMVVQKDILAHSIITCACVNCFLNVYIGVRQRRILAYPINKPLVVVKNRFVYISSITYFVLSVLCLIKRILCLQYRHFVTTYVISFNLLTSSVDATCLPILHLIPASSEITLLLLL
jgi:hypothetical protein